MRNKQGLAIFLIALICIGLAGCKNAKELSKTLGEIALVRNEIVRRFGEQNVDVRINRRASVSTFSITFINSPLNELPRDQRKERAQHTAEIVKELYPQIKTVDDIVVAFARVTTIFSIFHTRTVMDVHWFDGDARERDMVTADPTQSAPSPEEDPLDPKVTYQPARNETEIYNGGIQLAGVPEKGLIMIPRIMVRGKITKTNPPPPDTMRFDFASFADKPQFTGTTKINFVADKKFAYEGQFSESSSNDGLASEFLYLDIPYSDFKQIVSGKSLTVVIGKRQFALTEDQLRALGRLTQYVKETQ